MTEEQEPVQQNEHQCKNTEIFPQYWNILSESDKNGYLSLRSEINVLNTKRIFRDRTGTFTKILQLIQKYAERKEEDDWKRFLVCGICWVENGIAVNIRQLKILISKCKSSINGSLQKLGYLPSQLHVNTKLILFPLIPFLSQNYSDLRQWTIRFFQKYNTTNKSPTLTQNNTNPSPNTQTKNTKFPHIQEIIQDPKPFDRLEMHPIPIINQIPNKNNSKNSNTEDHQNAAKKILMPILITKNDHYIEAPKINMKKIENNQKTETDNAIAPFIIIPPKFRTITSPNLQNVK